MPIKKAIFFPNGQAPGTAISWWETIQHLIVADAYLKGMRGYDIETLWEALEHGANNVHPKVSASGRKGYNYYNKYGYIPNDVDVDQNVARSLEYAYDD